ncbi:hypothetical protein FRC19_001344 [Serendipita sp. 401]|nr:hypothetical protein FRC19_001344 [Serendipita sp. 401]
MGGIRLNVREIFERLSARLRATGKVRLVTGEQIIGRRRFKIRYIVIYHLSVERVRRRETRLKMHENLIDLSSEDEAVPARPLKPQQMPDIIDLTVDDEEEDVNEEEHPVPPPVLAAEPSQLVKNNEQQALSRIEKLHIEPRVSDPAPPSTHRNEGVAVEATTSATSNQGDERRKRSLTESTNGFPAVSSHSRRTSDPILERRPIIYNEPDFVARRLGIMNRKAPLANKTSTAPKLSSLHKIRTVNGGKQISAPKNKNIIRRITSTPLENLIPAVPTPNRVTSAISRVDSQQPITSIPTPSPPLHESPSQSPAVVVEPDSFPNDSPAISQHELEVPVEDTRPTAEPNPISNNEPDAILNIPTPTVAPAPEYNVEEASRGAGSTTRAAEGWFDRVPFSGWASRPEGQPKDPVVSAVSNVSPPVKPSLPVPQVPNSPVKKKKKKISLSSKEPEAFSKDWEERIGVKRKRSILDKEGSRNPATDDAHKKRKKEKIKKNHSGMESDAAADDDELFAHLHIIQNDISARTVKEKGDSLPTRETGDTHVDSVNTPLAENHTNPVVSTSEAPLATNDIEPQAGQSPKDADDTGDAQNISRVVTEEPPITWEHDFEQLPTVPLTDRSMSGDYNDDDDLALQFALMDSVDPDEDIAMQMALMQSANPVVSTVEVAPVLQVATDAPTISSSDHVQNMLSPSLDPNPVSSPNIVPTPVLTPQPGPNETAECDSTVVPEMDPAAPSPMLPANDTIEPPPQLLHGVIDRAELMRRRLLDANSSVTPWMPFFDGGYHNPEISPPFAPWTILMPFLSKKFDIERDRH